MCATLDGQGPRLQSVDPTESPFQQTWMLLQECSRYSPDLRCPLRGYSTSSLGDCPPFMCLSSLPSLPERSCGEGRCTTRCRSDEASAELRRTQHVPHEVSPPPVHSCSQQSFSMTETTERLCSRQSLWWPKPTESPPRILSRKRDILQNRNTQAFDTSRQRTDECIRT